MTTIWKFSLVVVDEQSIEMPYGAEILTVQMQKGIPCLWAKVDPQNKITTRKIAMHGTGHTCREDLGKYIGSFQMHNENLIFHTFEVQDAVI